MDNVKSLIAKIDALEQKATPGPWFVYADKLRPQFSTKIIEIQESLGAPIVAWPGFDGTKQPYKEKLVDAELMVALRNAWPALKAALRSLSPAVPELQARVDRLTDCLNHAVTGLSRAAFSENFDMQDCEDCLKKINNEFEAMGKTSDWHILNDCYDRLCAACGVDNGDEIDILPIVEKRLRSPALPEGCVVPNCEHPDCLQMNRPATHRTPGIGNLCADHALIAMAAESPTEKISAVPPAGWVLPAHDRETLAAAEQVLIAKGEYELASAVNDIAARKLVPPGEK